MAESIQAGPVPALSRRKRWMFRFVLILLLFALFECISCLGLHLINRRYPMDPLAAITPEAVEKLLSEGPRGGWRFDPELGWVSRPNSPKGPFNSIGARSTHEYSNLRATISVYGDSYTFCHGASVEDAWPTLLEEQLGVGVLNFGVGGYGTDQALLRLERQYKVVPSSTVLFCVQPENINRVVCIYKGFYEAGFSPVKPRFVVGENGLEVFNPWSSPDAVREILLDHQDRLLDLGRRYDYWFSDLAFLGAGAPWRIGFPYSYQLAARIPYIRSRLHIGATNIASHAKLFEPDTEAFQVMKGLLRRYRAFAHSNGFRELVAILPPPRDIYRYSETGVLTYQPLVDFLKAEAFPFVDVMDVLADESDIPASFVRRKHHYSRHGSMIVCREIAAFLNAENEIPDSTAPPDADVKSP